MRGEPERTGSPGLGLPWDSVFFGFRIGRLALRRLTPETQQAALAWAAAEKLRCAYFFADADCPATLALAHEGGFKFIDLRMDFSTELAPADDTTTTAGLRPATAADLPAIEALSRISHQDTRFSKDTNFPPARAAELYAEWIRRDFREHRILVVPGANSGVAGYVTCQTDPGAGLGRIGLIAVAGSEQRRGVGRLLAAGALAHFRQAGCRQARVATQASNVPAQRLYQSLGFRTAETCATYHRWF